MTINREQWLVELAKRINPRILKITGATSVPNFQISYGFPARKALSKKNRRLGQCWFSDDAGIIQVFISPVVSKPLEVAGVVAHELVHVNVGVEHGHRGVFADVVKELGLIGPPSETVPGKVFKAFIAPVLDEMMSTFGPLPHVGLQVTAQMKPQTTRLLKAMCLKCKYTVRVTSKWASIKPPICPVHMKAMKVIGG